MGKLVNRRAFFAFGVLSLGMFFSVACNDKSDPQAEAPPPLKLENVQDRNVFKLDKPEQFQLTEAIAHTSTSELRVTGTVTPDISRNVPVISIATGRVLEIRARLNDSVKKGQVLMLVQSADMSAAFSDHRKAVADEQLAQTQLQRARLLFDKGAISLNDVQVAEDAESKAKVDVENTTERLRVLGGSVDHPTPIVEIRAPVSGVITDQQVTAAAGVPGLGSPNPFTISDLSHVWILCDVYENDLSNVRVGEKAEIRLNAYPDRLFSGTIGSIGPILDPNIRTAKVRIEVANPGLMRSGMFVTAIFHGHDKQQDAAVPATAILHLHDRDWVYTPLDNKQFRRVEVASGNMLSGGMQEIKSGISPGQKIVANALEFQNAAEQ